MVNVHASHSIRTAPRANKLLQMLSPVTRMYAAPRKAVLAIQLEIHVYSLPQEPLEILGQLQTTAMEVYRQRRTTATVVMLA